MTDKYEVSSGSSFTAFPKLQGDNYYGWRENMLTMLDLLNQTAAVEGQVPEIIPAKPNEPTDPEKNRSDESGGSGSHGLLMHGYHH